MLEQDLGSAAAAVARARIAFAKTLECSSPIIRNFVAGAYRPAGFQYS